MGMEQVIWNMFVKDIATAYEGGELITHDFLKERFGLQTPKFDTFNNEFEYIKAIEMLNFEYMATVEKLRNDLLDEHQLYLKNLRGDGYVLLLPKEQTQFAEKKVKEEIKKALNTSYRIIANTRLEHLDEVDRRKNADALAKISHLKGLFKQIK